MEKSKVIAVYDVVKVKALIPRPATKKRMGLMKCNLCLCVLIPITIKLMAKIDKPSQSIILVAPLGKYLSVKTVNIMIVNPAKINHSLFWLTTLI